MWVKNKLGIRPFQKHAFCSLEIASEIWICLPLTLTRQPPTLTSELKSPGPVPRSETAGDQIQGGVCYACKQRENKLGKRKINASQD